MLSKLLIASGLTLALALPAAAQSTQTQSTQTRPSPGSATASGGSGQQASGGPSQGSMAFRQKMKQDLEQAGFTNVQVVPESFLIRATDKQGRPVVMMVDPNSAVVVTGMGGTGQSGSGSSGSTGSLTGNSGGSGTSTAK
jgi:hypothetical protein